MTNKLDFIQGNTRRCLLAMALPLTAAMFLNLAYNLVDALWIGNLLGEIAYAALTGCMPVILILTSVAMGMTNGVSILLSQAVGEKNRKSAESLIAASLLMSVLLSAGITLLLELCLQPLLVLLQTPAETVGMARDYLKIYLLGYPAVYLYCYFTAVLRSYGNSVFQMTAMLVCTVLNTVLDPVFIRLLGFQGAAAATLLSQAVCLGVMLAYLGRKKLFRFRFSSFDRACLAPLLAKGIPSTFQQSIPAISTGFLTSLIGGMGISALAAYGVMGKLETILFYPAMALNMVLTTIAGQCAGGRRCDRVRDYLRLALCFGGCLLLLLSILVTVFSRQLSLLFVSSAEAAGLVARAFRFLCAGYVLNTITNCFLGAVNGMGKPSRSLLCMVLYYLAVRIPLAWLFSFFGWGLDGVWAAVFLSHAVAAAAAAILANRQLSRLEKECSAAPDTAPDSGLEPV